MQPLYPDEIVDDPNIHMAVPSIQVSGDSNSIQVVDNTTKSPRMAYHCIISIQRKFRHTPAFRGHSLFSANNQSRGSGNDNKVQVEKTSTN